MITLDDSALRARFELLSAVGSQVSTELDRDLHSKKYAGWTDRTGNARQGLQVSNYSDHEVIGIEFGGTVPYMGPLEKKHKTFERLTEKYSDILRQELLNALSI